MSNSDPTQPPAGQPDAEQVFCPNCNGGNPPGTMNCMWCGKPMSGAATTNTGAEASSSSMYGGATTPVQPSQGYQSQAGADYMPPSQVDQPAQPAYSAAPPYAQPASVVTAPPPAKSGSGKRILLIVGGVLVGLLLLCGILFGSIFAGVMGLTQPAADQGERFMTALRDNNYDRAFELCSPSLQQEVGNAQALRDALASKQPTKWSFNSRNIQNDLAMLQGTTTYSTGETGTVDMELRKVGNDWKVSFINLK